MATVRNPHADSRLPQVLDEAARLFRSRGFEGTSVRDIARAVGMLPGSLYCHFATKEELLVAVYVKGVQQIPTRCSAAVAAAAIPGSGWRRPASPTWKPSCRTTTTRRWWCACGRPMSRRPTAAWSAARPVRGTVRPAVGHLPLARGTDRSALRLMLLGALNWSQVWYRPGGRLNPARHRAQIHRPAAAGAGGGGMSAKGEGPRLRGSTSASAACDRLLGPQLHDTLPEVAA